MEKYGKLCSTITELNFRSSYNAAEKFEDIKGVIRSRKLKKGWQHIVQKVNDKSTNNDLQNTTQDRIPRTSLKTYVIRKS